MDCTIYDDQPSVTFCPFIALGVLDHCRQFSKWVSRTALRQNWIRQLTNSLDLTEINTPVHMFYPLHPFSIDFPEPFLCAFHRINWICLQRILSMPTNTVVIAHINLRKTVYSILSMYEAVLWRMLAFQGTLKIIFKWKWALAFQGMLDNFNIKTLQMTNSYLSKISKWKDKIMVWENVLQYKYILILKNTKGNSIQTDSYISAFVKMKSSFRLDLFINYLFF